MTRRLRTRTIHDLDILEIEDRRVLLRVTCESGTYIRKLCHDLGLALGLGAHMGDLRRTGTTPFDDTSLATFHDLSDAIAYEGEGEPGALTALLQPAEQALTHLPWITIAPSAAEAVSNGAPIYAPGVISADSAEVGDLIVGGTPEGTAVCLGRLVGDPHADKGLVVDLERVLV